MMRGLAARSVQRGPALARRLFSSLENHVGRSVIVTGGAKGRGYLDKVPKDPWRNEYQYASPGTHMEFDVWSLGADGTAGGADAGQDIGNWNMDELR